MICTTLQLITGDEIRTISPSPLEGDLILQSAMRLMIEPTAPYTDRLRGFLVASRLSRYTLGIEHGSYQKFLTALWENFEEVDPIIDVRARNFVDNRLVYRDRTERHGNGYVTSQERPKTFDEDEIDPLIKPPGYYSRAIYKPEIMRTIIGDNKDRLWDISVLNKVRDYLIDTPSAKRLGWISYGDLVTAVEDGIEIMVDTCPSYPDDPGGRQMEAEWIAYEEKWKRDRQAWLEKNGEEAQS